jgi:hypothetical protein
MRLDRAAGRPRDKQTSGETMQQCEVAAPLHPHQRTGHVQDEKLLHKRTINIMKNRALINTVKRAATPKHMVKVIFEGVDPGPGNG